MLKIPARSKLLNLQNSVKLYYILAIGAFITILTFVLYRDFVVSGTMLISTLAAFFITSRPPLKIVIEIEEDGISIGDEKIKWEICSGWCLSDLGSTLEFTVQTTQITQQFYYYYIDTNQPGVSELISLLSSYLPYSEEIASKNIVHTALRILGIR